MAHKICGLFTYVYYITSRSEINALHAKSLKIKVKLDQD